MTSLIPVPGPDIPAPMSEPATGAISLVPARAEVSGPPPSLFDLEMNHQALVDSIETVEPDQEQQFLADFRASLTTVKDKRDRLAAFLAYCEAMAEMASKEIVRLQKRRDFFIRTVGRLEGFAEMILRELGKDAKGKWLKLEGNLSIFTLRNLPPTTIITDEAAVPSNFKTVTVTLPALLWEKVVDSLDMDLANQVLDAVKRPASSVSKTAVKDAIEKQVPDWKEQLKDRPSVFCPEVPGAAIAVGGTKLVRT